MKSRRIKRLRNLGVPHYYIYALLDPRDNQPRYVGRTQNPHRREKQFCSFRTNNPDLKSWLIELRVFSLKPIYKILQAPQQKRSKSERWWILYLSRKGNKLFNIRGLYERETPRGINIKILLDKRFTPADNVSMSKSEKKIAVNFRLPKHELDRIRRAAKLERRTLTAFFLLAGLQRCTEIERQEKTS